MQKATDRPSRGLKRTQEISDGQQREARPVKKRTQEIKQAAKDPSASASASSSTPASGSASAGDGKADKVAEVRQQQQKEGDCSRFHTTPKELKATLAKYGVAIVPGVLDEKKRQHMIDGFWNYVEHVTQKLDPPMNRKKPETWGQFKHLWPIHSMMLKQFGCGQCQMMWDLRQDPAIANIFATLYGVRTEDLITSYDGFSALMAPEILKRGFQMVNKDGSPKPWWHFDQSPLCNDFKCVQSWVTPYDTDEGDATLGVLEGSHLLHGKFALYLKEKFKAQYKLALEQYTLALEHKLKDDKARNSKEAELIKPKEAELSRDNWYKLDAEDLAWYRAQGCHPVYVTCKAGDMVCWDSRTVHYGRQAMKGRAGTDHHRLVAYICMVPRKLATPVMLKKRIKAVDDRRTTSHWPHLMKLNPAKPRTYGSKIVVPFEDIVAVPAPILTPLGRRLVGHEK